MSTLFRGRTPDSRKKGRTQTYRIHVGEHMAEAGYRILWIHSESKERLERKSREQRMAKAEQALEKLSSGLNQRSLKTYLEKRFQTHKSVLEAAPLFLEKPRRIEAMMFLYFIALMLVSLIERRIRREMQACNIESLPMRPAGMHTKRPTWRTIMDSFHGVHLATIERSGEIIHTALKGLNALRQRILTLLKVPVTTYTTLRDRWWMFALE